MRQRLAIILTVLSAYALLLKLWIGNIGFWGDSWWILRYGAEYPLIKGIYYYAINERRPVEGAYAISLYKLFGADQMIYGLLSLLLLALASVLLGYALLTAFPQQRTLAIISPLFAFFMPMLLEATYYMQFDNGRLQMVLFWLAVIALQQKRDWWWLPIPAGLYFLSTLAYESAALLIVVMPLFVIPVWLRGSSAPRRAVVQEMILKIGGVLVMGFAAFLITRMFILSGGRIAQKYWIPPFGDLWNFSKALLDFLIVPFEQFQFHILGLGVMLLIGAILLRQPADDPQEPRRLLYIATIGLLIILFGTIPFLLAGYTPTLRTYSSSSYGVAILLGLLVTFPTQTALKQVMQGVVIIIISIWAVYPLTLRGNFQEAARQRQTIFTSVIEQVPAVAPNTTFLLLDFQSTYQGADIIAGETGLIAYFRTLYDDPSVSAHFLYYADHPQINEEGRLAVVSADGVVARRRDPANPIPFDQIILLQRQGDQVILLDSISSEDKAGIQWQEGITEIRTNPALILPSTDRERQQQIICCNWR